MNSTKAKAISDFEAGNITAREFGRILARMAMRKGSTNRKPATRKNSRWT